MISNIVAQRYVQALYELAGEQEKYDKIGVQIKSVRDLLNKNGELDTLFRNPALDPQKKLNVFAEIAPKMQLDELAVNFVKVLVKKRRISYLDSMCKEYDRLERDRKGVVAIELTTAKALDTEASQRIQKQLSNSIGKDVEMITNEDPSLIGGMIARIGSTVYDGSLGHQLERLQQRLGEE